MEECIRWHLLRMTPYHLSATLDVICEWFPQRRSNAIFYTKFEQQHSSHPTKNMEIGARGARHFMGISLQDLSPCEV